MKCETCRYWVRSEPEIRLGMCHLDPPIVVYVTDSSRMRTVWPITKISEWCGQHEVQAPHARHHP